MNQKKIYFPNLNGLRFIAAFLVIIHHIELVKSIFKMENHWDSFYPIKLAGKLGVILFFVLSGFLITYLLLDEECQHKEFNIKNFYIRRILRIWPLYFLIIFLAFVILPNIDLFTFPTYDRKVIYTDLSWKIFLYIMFLPNLASVIFGRIPYASQTWSIGTEEQFYLIWPIILRHFKRHRISIMFFIIVAHNLLSQTFYTPHLNFLPHKNIIQGFWSSFNINCMSIGGVFAILLFKKSALLKIIQNNTVFYITLILLVLLITNGIYISLIHNEFYSLLFGIVILNFATNKQIGFTLENKLLNYLGNISYGLYMYHMIAIVLSILICKALNYEKNWLIYSLSFITTIIMAGLSYKYFESIFLNLKNNKNLIN